ncbi:MAG: T9SS type A sorting domain-containing protein [Bacteroidota bacterium]
MKKALLSLLLVSTFYLQAQTVGTFSFNVNGTAPAGLSAALNVAAQRWSNYLIITVPVKVNVFFVNSASFPFSAITLANGRTNFAGAPVSNFIYTSSLANQLAATELNPGEFDMDIYVNLATNYYFGTGKPAANQSDFISTIMHEIGHGIGFYSSGYVNSSNIGSFGNVPASALFPLITSFPWHGQDGYPSIYDKFIIKPSQNNLVSIAPNNSATLGDSIKYRLNYFNGPTYANATNGGNPVKLSGGTGAYTLGVDLLHIHASVCNSIMSYCWGNGDTVRMPAAWEMGILKEIGWNSVNNKVMEISDDEAFSVFPNPAGTSFEIAGDQIQSVDLYNLQGQIVNSFTNYQNSHAFKIDVECMNPGMYYAVVHTKNKNITGIKKVVIN